MPHDSVFKALADPTRRAILRMLRHGEMTAGQIGERFHISAASMSHHFNALKAADLVFVRREGQFIYYSLNTTVFQDVIAALMDMLAGGAGEQESTRQPSGGEPDEGGLR